MPTTTKQRVRVVLVNYSSATDIRKRLSSEALEGQDIVVVDNASQPKEVEDLCAEFGATAVLLPVNTGFAGGVNAAVALIRGREPLPLLLLNPDAELARRDLDRLLEELAVPGTTGTAPLLAEPSGRLQVGPGGGPLTVGSVAGYFLMGSHLLPWWRGLFLTRRQSLHAGSVHWLCMASLLLTPDAFERFGALPEDEIVYGEDVAWGTSATERGAVFRLVPDIVVGHPHGSSGGGTQWSAALQRLLIRRLGPRRGHLARMMLLAGLALRRAAGRDVGDR